MCCLYNIYIDCIILLLFVNRYLCIYFMCYYYVLYRYTTCAPHYIKDNKNHSHLHYTAIAVGLYYYILYSIDHSRTCTLHLSSRGRKTKTC